jgi:tRNA dimethylallyltransferase
VARDHIRAGAQSSFLALIGPTASGKTAASIAVAEAVDAEIVSIDSTNVYRGIDVGTAKPDPEQRARVPHHLLDLVEPGADFSVARFQSLALEAVAGIRGRGREALLVGGSGLYYRAVVDGLEFPGTVPRVRRQLEAEVLALGAEGLHRRLGELDPRAAARIEPANARRTVRALEVAAITGRRFSSFASAWDRYPPGVVVAGIDVPRPVLHRRIEERAAKNLPGLLAEASLLVERGHGAFIRSSQIIGYAEALECLEGRISEEEALRSTIRRTKALARRQLAWFRRDPRVRWFGAGEESGVSLTDALIRFFRARTMALPSRPAMKAEA